VLGDLYVFPEKVTSYDPSQNAIGAVNMERNNISFVTKLTWSFVLLPNLVVNFFFLHLILL
jgi:hypothetical protein